MDVEERRQKVRKTLGVFDDRRGGGRGRLGVAAPGREMVEQDLRMTLDERERRPHVVPGHGEDVLSQPLELALAGDVAERDDATLQLTL